MVHMTVPESDIGSRDSLKADPGSTPAAFDGWGSCETIPLQPGQVSFTNKTKVDTSMSMGFMSALQCPV